MTSQTIVGKLKNHSSRYGKPDTIISDNEPQLTSSKFHTFFVSNGTAHMKPPAQETAKQMEQQRQRSK